MNQALGALIPYKIWAQKRTLFLTNNVNNKQKKEGKLTFQIKVPLGNYCKVQKANFTP